ncbi:MAG: ABC transporter substrate-binding protein [Solirubrobacterales bacterium]
MKIICLVAALAAATALLGGCGGSEGQEAASKPPAISKAEAESLEPADTWVTLDGHADAANVGILLALERGYFDDLGLSVGVGAPALPGRPVSYVSTRTADIGVSQQPQVVLAKDKRAPVIAVGSLLPRSTLSMIWLRKSKIRDIADLKGRTVAVPGIPYQGKLLRLLLEQAGLTLRDVKIRVVGYNLVPALVSGRADAIFGGSWNLEGAVLRAHSMRPVIIPVRRLGVPVYDEAVVIARTRRVARSPQLIRKFMAAVARGTAAAIKNPEAAVQAIEKSPEGGNVFGHKAVEAEVKATLPLLSRTGRLSPAHTRTLVNWMHEQSLIEREPRGSELQALHLK